MNFEKYSKNDLTKILLNVLEMDEKDTDKILNIFIFGSILYKTATENSGKKYQENPKNEPCEA